MGNCQGCPFQQAQARSQHPGKSVHVAFCDGTVRTVQANVPQAIWWAMNGRDDAIVFGLANYAH